MDTGKSSGRSPRFDPSLPFKNLSTRGFPCLALKLAGNDDRRIVPPPSPAESGASLTPQTSDLRLQFDDTGFGGIAGVVDFVVVFEILAARGVEPA